MIDICCKHLKRRTDFRFLAVHTCVISITFLTNHGGSTSTAMSTATVHATTRLHLQMYYQSRPMDGGRLRWPVSPSQRPAVQIGIPHTGALICASDMPAASPQKCTRHTGKDLPPLQTRLTRAKAHGMHRRSMIWHAAVFLYTKTDRDCASLGIIVEAGA
jgi:hypothetical protein